MRFRLTSGVTPPPTAWQTWGWRVGRSLEVPTVSSPPVSRAPGEAPRQGPS